MTPAAPATAPHIPNAMLRAFPVNVVESIDSVEGDAIAAPNPCTARPTSIWVRFCDIPSIIEPMTKMATPTTNIRFLPNSSPSFPQVNRKAPKIRPYSEVIHSRSLTETPENVACIEGRALFTIVKSITMTEMERQQTRRVSSCLGAILEDPVWDSGSILREVCMAGYYTLYII